MWRFTLNAVEGNGYHGYEWRWCRRDDCVTMESDRGFPTYDACVSDARLHGIPETEIPEVSAVMRESRRNNGY